MVLDNLLLFMCKLLLLAATALIILGLVASGVNGLWVWFAIDAVLLVLLFALMVLVDETGKQYAD